MSSCKLCRARALVAEHAAGRHRAPAPVAVTFAVAPAGEACLPRCPPGYHVSVSARHGAGGDGNDDDGDSDVAADSEDGNGSGNGGGGGGKGGGRGRSRNRNNRSRLQELSSLVARWQQGQ